MKRLIANVIPEETRLAVVEDGELIEFSVERPESPTLVGSVYKGRVQRILPGMQAAFVDIGQEKNAFLYTGDQKDGIQLHEGQDVLIQIAKEGFGSKGPKATLEIILPGRHLALSPSNHKVGLSRRIENESERERLRLLAETLCPDKMGVIVRTAAEGATEEELRHDMEHLQEIWRQLLARYQRSNAPALLYRDLDLAVRMVRDYFTADTHEVIVDDPYAYQCIRELLADQLPELVDRLVLYKEKEGIFSHYQLKEQMKRLHQRVLDLPSGGTIVIDHTEALTVIDINTSKFVGRSHLADTAYQTNLEAVREIAKQIRLRDLGGMILVDFIDMSEKEREGIQTLLKSLVKSDRTRVHLVGFTTLGLMEMTRKKIRKDLLSRLQSSCPFCQGRGTLFTAESVAISAIRELRRRKNRLQNRSVLIQVHPDVAEFFRARNWLPRLEKELSLKLKIEPLTTLRPDVYTLLGDETDEPT